MPKFNEFIKGFEEAEQPKTQEVKVEQPQPKEEPKPQPKDNYVIFKENGKFRGTPRSNYNARVRDANKIQDYDDFTSHEQIRDYLMKYGSDKDPSAYEFEDYEAPKDEWENDAELEKTPYSSIKDYKGQSITQETGGYMVSTNKGDHLFKSVAEAKEFINKNQPQEANPQPKQGSFQEVFGESEQPQVEEFKPNPKADDLIKRYYAHEFDLGQLHDQLIKVFGSIKPAFEYLLKRTRR